MKTVFKGFVLVVLFISAWFMLTQIDWLNLTRSEEFTKKTQEKLGDIFWEVFKESGTVNDDSLVNEVMGDFLMKIAQANQLDTSSIKIHVLMKDELNAFALPGGRIVFYSKIIRFANSPEEICGVLGHELAHHELNHISQKLIKEFGISVLISISTGGAGAEMAKQLAKWLSSTAFDRHLEKEADLKAVDYLVAAGINPVPFANFLTRLADEAGALPNYLSWVSTHPDSYARTAYILDYSRQFEQEFEPVLDSQTWEQVRDRLWE